MPQNKKSNKENRDFQRKTGILIKILVPLLLSGLPIIIISYSDFLAQLFSPYIPEIIMQKIPLIVQDVEFQTRLILILTLLIALFLGLLISFHFSRSLERVSEGLKKVLTGNLDFKIKIGSRDEIGEVSYFFNQLVKNLKDAQSKLEIQKQELNKKSEELIEKIKSLELSAQETEKGRLATLNILEDVEEARLALQERVEELEKLNRLAVGRELRMIELKEKIKRLEEKIEGQKSSSNGKT